MSLILFFGLALMIFVVGVIYSGLVIRHHLQKRADKLKPKSETGV